MSFGGFQFNDAVSAVTSETFNGPFGAPGFPNTIILMLAVFLPARFVNVMVYFPKIKKLCEEPCHFKVNKQQPSEYLFSEKTFMLINCYSKSHFSQKLMIKNLKEKQNFLYLVLLGED